jgi:hypothetical protein
VVTCSEKTTDKPLALRDHRRFAPPSLRAAPFIKGNTFSWVVAPQRGMKNSLGKSVFDSLRSDQKGLFGFFLVS